MAQRPSQNEPQDQKQDRYYPFRSWQALDEYKGFEEEDSEDELAMSGPNGSKRDPGSNDDLEEENEF